MFRMIGYGDNIGSGFQKILAAWNTLGYIRPDLKELDDVKEVWLSLPLIRTSKSDKGTSKSDSTVNSTVDSTLESKNPIEGQVNYDLGQANSNKGQANNDLGQVKPEQGQENEILGIVKKQENLSDKQKEILIYLLKHPSESLKNCSDATGASPKSIRYTFKKVSSWLNIHHEGPDKTGIWIFELK